MGHIRHIKCWNFVLVFLLISFTQLFSEFKYKEPLISPGKLIENIESSKFQGQPMTLHCVRDNISLVLKKFENVSGLTFNVDETVIGKIRLFVNNLPWDQVLALVLDKADLKISMQDKIFLVERKNLLDFSDKISRGKKFIGEPIRFVYKNMDIRNLIVEFYRKYSKDYGRLEVVLYPGITGKVSCDLGTIPWDKGLSTVLKNLGLNMTITGNLMIVKKSPAYNKIHFISPEFLLKNLKKKEYSGQIIRLFIKEISLHDFFIYLGHISCLNFKLEKNITDKIAVECLRVSWDRLLTMVLYSHDLDIVLHDGDIRVGRIDRAIIKKPNQKIVNTIPIEVDKPEEFSFKNIDLETVTRWFADKYSINLVFNPGCMKGKKVNYHHGEILWSDALTAILTQNGLEFEFEEGSGVVGHFLKIRKK